MSIDVSAWGQNVSIHRTDGNAPLILGYVGGKPAEEPYLTISRVAASYYFFHFLVLVPFIARIEKPLPLPDEQAE